MAKEKEKRKEKPKRMSRFPRALLSGIFAITGLGATDNSSDGSATQEAVEALKLDKLDFENARAQLIAEKQSFSPKVRNLLGFLLKDPQIKSAESYLLKRGERQIAEALEILDKIPEFKEWHDELDQMGKPILPMIYNGKTGGSHNGYEGLIFIAPAEKIQLTIWEIVHETIHARQNAIKSSEFHAEEDAYAQTQAFLIRHKDQLPEETADMHLINMDPDFRFHHFWSAYDGKTIPEDAGHPENIDAFKDAVRILFWDQIAIGDTYKFSEEQAETQKDIIYTEAKLGQLTRDKKHYPYLDRMIMEVVNDGWTIESAHNITEIPFVAQVEEKIIYTDANQLLDKDAPHEFVKTLAYMIESKRAGLAPVNPYDPISTLGEAEIHKRARFAAMVASYSDNYHYDPDVHENQGGAYQGSAIVEGENHSVITRKEYLAQQHSEDEIHSYEPSDNFKQLEDFIKGEISPETMKEYENEVKEMTTCQIVHDNEMEGTLVASIHDDKDDQLWFINYMHDNSTDMELTPENIQSAYIAFEKKFEKDNHQVYGPFIKQGENRVIEQIIDLYVDEKRRTTKEIIEEKKREFEKNKNKDPKSKSYEAKMAQKGNVKDFNRMKKGQR